MRLFTPLFLMAATAGAQSQGPNLPDKEWIIVQENPFYAAVVDHDKSHNHRSGALIKKENNACELEIYFFRFPNEALGAGTYTTGLSVNGKQYSSPYTQYYSNAYYGSMFYTLDQGDSKQAIENFMVRQKAHKISNNYDIFTINPMQEEVKEQVKLNCF